MYLIPKVMSTQHPDNATPAPFSDEAGVLKGEGEVAEAASVFAMGCDEQMWDSEGKEADSQVVRKLLTSYPDLFEDQFHLGRDIAVTLRVPNPHIEQDMRKSMVEALQSVPSAWDMAHSFYGDGHAVPIQEVILPLTTSAEEVSLVEAYYRKVIVGHEDQVLLDDQTVRDWVGEFHPKRVRVIPLIEDMESILSCDRIVEEYVRDRDLPHQRVFLARSDPALNYGIIGAELMLKVGLLRLHNLEERLGLSLYPIIGAGSVPFRGHLTPLNIERAHTEYPTAQTLTVQSAFKYDYDEERCTQRYRANSQSGAGPAGADRGGPRPRDHRQDHRRVPGERAEPDRRHQGRVCPRPETAGTQNARWPLRLRPLPGRRRRRDAAAGDQLHGVPVLHRHSAGTAGTRLADRERPAIRQGRLPEPVRGPAGGPALRQ